MTSRLPLHWMDNAEIIFENQSHGGFFFLELIFSVDCSLKMWIRLIITRVEILLEN